MRKGAFVLFVLLVNPLLTPSTSVLAQNYVQRFANGWIDWSNRIVEAVGVGTPPFDAINPAHARAVAKSGAESDPGRMHAAFDAGWACLRLPGAAPAGCRI